MSNQVFANNTQRYFPATEQKDTFTLIKNNIGPPAYGSRPFVLQRAGSPIQFNRLNGIDLQASGSGWPYGTAQSPATKPYWTLSASVTSTAALSLTSNVNNSVAVECIMPGYITGYNGVFAVKLCLLLLDNINSLATAKVVAMDQRDVSTNGSVTQETWQFSTIVNMTAGQVLQAYIYIASSDPPGSWITLDDTNGLNKILVESSMSFTKL